MANIQTPAGTNITQSTGLGLGPITQLDPNTVTQIQSMLGRLGYYQGPQNGVVDFATAAALVQFNITFGIGDTADFNTDSAYSLLYAHGFVANNLPAPWEVYNSLALAKQYNPGLNVVIPKLDEPAPTPVQLPAPTVPGPGQGGGGPATPAPAPTNTRQKASDLLSSTLRAWGFDDQQTNGLVNWAWGKIQSGASDAEILDTLYQTPEFKAAFPEYVARQQAGLPISVSDILNYRQSFADLTHYYGLGNVYTSADVKSLAASLITNNVSLAEANDRIVKGFNEISNAPPEAQQIFGQWYGPTSQAALAAYFLAPDQALPNLERQVQMAEIAGAGARFNLGVGQGLAETLARQGVSQNQALQGFQQIDYLAPLFNETVTETQDLTPLGEGVGAVFGTEPGAQATLQRRQESRKAALSGSGGAFVTEKGVVGLGSAS